MKPNYFLVLLVQVLLFHTLTARAQSDANNKFAFKFYHQLSESSDNDNIFYSPFSISTALAMTYAGAKNETALEMQRALHFRNYPNFHSDNSNYIQMIENILGESMQFSIANSLWAQYDYPILESFQDVIQHQYKSDIRSVDFKSEAERLKTAEKINTWVDTNTNHKILDLLDPKILNSYTRLILVNTIYLNAKWITPFECTEQSYFHCADKQLVADMMKVKHVFNYYEDSAIKVLELPYTDEKVSMIVFLPKEESGLVSFEKNFDHDYYQKIVANLKPEETNVSLPSFDLSFKSDLVEKLKEIGMLSAFDGCKADFSGINEQKELFIGQVIHQAKISVSEKGTEAAAATAVIFEIRTAALDMQVKYFTADHPFIFCIKENVTGNILFMGRVTDPTIKSTPL